MQTVVVVFVLYYSILCLIGIFVSIGPIIDEVQEYKYMNNIHTSKARTVLLIFWLFMAFILTLSYKEVLVANLVNVGYEDSIDNFGDVLHSGQPICVPENTLIPHLLFNDPRDNVKQLLDKLLYYNFTGAVPEWIRKG